MQKLSHLCWPRLSVLLGHLEIGLVMLNWTENWMKSIYMLMSHILCTSPTYHAMCITVSHGNSAILEFQHGDHTINLDQKINSSGDRYPSTNFNFNSQLIMLSVPGEVFGTGQISFVSIFSINYTFMWIWHLVSLQKQKYANYNYPLSVTELKSALYLFGWNK